MDQRLLDLATRIAEALERLAPPPARPVDLDAADAFVAVRSLAPDVVLLDIRLPDLDGFGVAEVLAGDEDAPAVVLVSSRSRGDYGPRVDASPALGFIAKHDLTGDALRDVLSGSP